MPTSMHVRVCRGGVPARISTNELKAYGVMASNVDAPSSGLLCRCEPQQLRLGSPRRAGTFPPLGKDLGWHANFADKYTLKHLIGTGAYGKVSRRPLRWGMRACPESAPPAWCDQAEA